MYLFSVHTQVVETVDQKSATLTRWGGLSAPMTSKSSKICILGDNKQSADQK